MFFEKNMQALMQADAAHQVLREQLLQVAELTDEDYEFFETEDGHFTLKYQGVFLHDPKSPLTEAQEMFEKSCLPAFDQVHLILGIGLGYALDRVFEGSPGKILIYEPNQSLLRFILDNVDLSKYLASGRVWVAATQFDLLGLLARRIYGDHQLDVMALRSYAYLLASDIPELMDRIVELTGNWVQDYRTGEHFHFQWIQQFFANYHYFAAIPTTDSLLKAFPDKPALVISRGPSLDTAMASVKALADSVVLIAVGGAIRPLWEAGVIPDFALFYDANGMREQLAGIPDNVLEQITFVMSPFTQQCCFDTPSRGKVLFLGENNSHFANVLDAAFGKTHHRLEGGGTVSLLAYQMAQAMACSPIILVGQDLAFPNNQVYAGGIALQVDEQGKMALSKSATLYAEPETMDTVLAQDGVSELPTLKAYVSFIRHFEELAVKNSRQAKPAMLYNSSLGGAKLDGFALRNLADFVGTFPAWKTQGVALNEAPGLSSSAVTERIAPLLQALQTLKAELQEALQLCAEIPKHFPPLSQSLVYQEAIRLGSVRFYNYMQAHPFLAYTVLFEMLQYKRKYKEASQLENRAEAVRDLVDALLNNSCAIWNDKISPWIAQAEQALMTMLETLPSEEACSHPTAEHSKKSENMPDERPTPVGVVGEKGLS